MGVHIGWDPGVFEEVDAPFDPSDPGTSLVTDKFPLYRAGKLDAAHGVVYNLRGVAMPALGAGEPIGIDGPEPFALLRFQALSAAEHSPLVVQASGSVGFVPMPISISPSDLSFEPQTITVVETFEPSLVESTTTLDPTVVSERTARTATAGTDEPTATPQAEAEALVGLQVNLYDDAGGVPGAVIGDETVAAGERFFVEITAEDLRDVPRGIGGLSVDVAWDAGVFQEIDDPFDPTDPASDLVTESLPLYRSGSLDNDAGAISDLGGVALQATVQFTTEVSTGSDDLLITPLVRPAYPDEKQYIEVKNTGSSPLAINEIQINAPDVTIDIPLTADPADDLTLRPGESERFRLRYAPSVPNPEDAATQSFNVPDGLVILSNAENAPRIEIALLGESTFDADITYDGQVNIADVVMLDDRFGREVGDDGYHPSSDPNGDGAVDMGDFGTLNAQFRLGRGEPVPGLLTAPVIPPATDAVLAEASPGDLVSDPAAGELDELAAAVTAAWGDQDESDDESDADESPLAVDPVLLYGT